MSLRIVFMGTPEFAVPSLNVLVENGYDVAGVVTATDKLGGRGKSRVLESAVKKYATARGIPVLQPPNLKAPEFIEELAALGADLQVVVAFRMLPRIVWDMPPMGTMNLHGSLLPKYRGAAPINWAIIRGETVTGVSTFLLKHEIDTGDILMQRSMSIGPNETAGEIHDRMMQLGAEVVLESVRALEANSIQPISQDPSGVTHAPKITRDTCEIDFTQSAGDVHNFIRGLSPYPTSWTTLSDQTLKVFRAGIVSSTTKKTPGSVSTDGKTFLHVACGTGAVELLEVQLEGKKRMGIAQFLNGVRLDGPTLVGRT